jgi:hypothetical protein
VHVTTRDAICRADPHAKQNETKEQAENAGYEHELSPSSCGRRLRRVQPKRKRRLRVRIRLDQGSSGGIALGRRTERSQIRHDQNPKDRLGTRDKSATDTQADPPGQKEGADVGVGAQARALPSGPALITHTEAEPMRATQLVYAPKDAEHTLDVNRLTDLARAISQIVPRRFNAPPAQPAFSLRIFPAASVAGFFIRHPIRCEASRSYSAPEPMAPSSTQSLTPPGAARGDQR